MEVGEKYEYGFCLLRDLKDRQGLNFTHVSYDIACQFKKSAIRKCPNSQTVFGVPSFHAHAHTSECLFKNSVSYTQGFGRVDGEMVERVWAWVLPAYHFLSQMSVTNRNIHLSFIFDALSLERNSKLFHLLTDWFRKATGFAMHHFQSLNSIFKALEAANREFHLIGRNAHVTSII